MVVFGQKWLYSIKVVVFGQSGCILSKMVVFGKQWFYSGKWLYSGTGGCILANLLHSGKSCCNREKGLCLGKVDVLGQK